MTLDDLLTLPLHKRIEWLRRKAGSHDKLAAQLGTTRQTVIGWEKGAQPKKDYREKLAAFSGFPAETFRRSAAEREVWALTETRLQELEAANVERAEDAQDQAQLIAELIVRVERLEDRASEGRGTG